MLLRLSRAVTARLRHFAVLPALAAAFICASAASASAATPLTGETLTASGPTTSGYRYGDCATRNLVQGGVTFTNVSGTASGPYPGTFTATGAFSVFGHRNPPFQISFHATFTITSADTTITGTISSKYSFTFGLGIGCTPSGGEADYSTSMSANYTAAINGQSYQGTGGVSGTFATTVGAQTSLDTSITG
jgi:hypothetical protein